MPNPVPIWPADNIIEALDGTVDPITGLPYIAKGTVPSSTPSLQVQEHRQFQRMYELLDRGGRVFHEGGLNVGITEIKWRTSANRFTYDGATGVAVPDDATTFLWLDIANVLQQGAALPGTGVSHMPLAEVTTVAGQVVSPIVDLRGWGRNFV